MTDRMNATSSDRAETFDAAETTPPDVPAAASVVVAVTVVAGVDPQATLEAVGKQRHVPAAVRLIGATDSDAPRGVVLNEDLEGVVADLDPSVDYVWILHGDAEPRPDALGALVAEADRFEASLAGSKLLVGGTRDTLEGVGSATDVFGEPYSGLDEGEVDLEQYDVVRDVAFVSSVSMLVRRDLLKGLRGLDSVLAPVAAGLDLSQRVRIAGGRVIVVPSSEVFHHRRCGRGDGGWREQAGRLRAMLKAYRPITLLWMIPFAFFNGLLDSLGGLLLGRWRLIPRYGLTWLWNLRHLPSTVGARRVLSRVRQVGDEELFRYQVRGSVRLRQVGSELSERILGAFDDDRPMARRASEVFNSGATWGLIGACVLVAVGLRSIFLSGLPVVGYALPFGDDPLAALERFSGGWNAAGLGTTAAVHPSLGPAALLQLVLFGNEEPARSLLTLAAFLLGVFGVGRLGRRLRVGGAGAYLGGVAALFGLPAALLAGQGRWTALVGIGLLPWALSSVLGQGGRGPRAYWGAVGKATLWVAAVSAFVPLLGVVPLLFSASVRLLGRFQSRPLVALPATAGSVVGLPYLLGRGEALLDGVAMPIEVGVFGLVVITAAVLAGMVAGSWRASFLGGAMTLGGLTLAQAVGPEMQEALLAVAAVGVGVVVAAALKIPERREPATWLAAGVGAVVVVVSLTGMAGGRGGLAADAWGRDVAFISMSAVGVERALLVADSPASLPGESRAGPGLWYRLVDSRGATLDQAVLGPPGDGDRALEEAIYEIASGATLEPGEMLAPFGIRWLVLAGDAGPSLRPALDAQFDLNPLPLAERLVVYENTVSVPVAETTSGRPWEREGTGFAGDPDDRVRLAVQGGPGWTPDWQSDDWAGTVDGSDGRADYTAFQRNRLISLMAAVAVTVSVGLAIWGGRADS